MARQELIRPRPDWNLKGPAVPSWFRRALKRIDPNWVLQFIPPKEYEHDEGVNPDIYPHGVWDICYRLPRTRFLHPRVVFSLADPKGNFSSPSPRTLRLLRQAKLFHRRGQSKRLEETLDRALVEANAARCQRSENRLREALAKYCSVRFGRQFTNRVYLRNDAPRETSQ